MRALILAVGAGLMLAQAAVADERLERLERSLQLLAPEERLEQLCNYIAMQQIRQDDKNFRPDRTVANAAAEPTEKGDTIEAKGAAFRSRGKWYALSYTCSATPDRSAVFAADSSHAFDSTFRRVPAASSRSPAN